MTAANFVLVYGLTAAVFFLIDLLWLGFIAKGFYDRHLGDLMRDQVNWVAAVMFYLIYIAGWAGDTGIFSLIHCPSNTWA